MAHVQMRVFAKMCENRYELSNEFKLRIAEENELQALLELWTEVLQASPDEFTSMYWSCAPVKRRTFVIECDSKIVSSAQLYILTLRDENVNAVHVGGIANVATLPEYRHRGFASKLIKAAYDDMRAAGCSWSLLYTGIPSFFEQFGWRPIHRNFLAVNVPNGQVVDSHSDIVVQNPPDLERLRMMCEASFVSPVSQIRGELDWKYKIPQRIVNKVVFTGEDSYAIVRVDDSHVTLEEWGMPVASILKFQNIIESVASWMGSQQQNRLVVTAPIMLEARQVLESMFSQVDELDELRAMVRPISRSWPMSRLVSLFSLPEARFLRLDRF